MSVDRYELLEHVAEALPDNALVMSTYIGATAFEWAAITDEHPRTAFLGQMGNVIGLAVGLALAVPHRPVFCIDGDGSALMELGQLVAMGQEQPANLVVIVVDNECYESIGSGVQGPHATATARRANLSALAAAAGVPHTANITSLDELRVELKAAVADRGCRFLNVKTRPGSAHVPPRQRDGFEDKYRFVRHVEQTEQRQILTLAQQDRQLMAGPSARTEKQV